MDEISRCFADAVAIRPGHTRPAGGPRIREADRCARRARRGDDTAARGGRADTCSVGATEPFRTGAGAAGPAELAARRGAPGTRNTPASVGRLAVGFEAVRAADGIAVDGSHAAVGATGPTAAGEYQ